MNMRRRFAVDLLAAVAAVAVTRILFRSRLLYDIDSVNFALALGRFDPSSHQPHPPGYYLYVVAGRLLQRVVPDANTALVAISIAASCAVVCLLYALTRDWFGIGPARVAAALFVVSPLCWFHGTVALVYMVEMAASVTIGYLCWKAVSGRPAALIAAAAMLALAAGFRPSTALMLGPMWLFAAFQCGRRTTAAAFAAGGLVTCAWAVPMLREAGGFSEYWTAFWQLWSMVPARRTVLASPWLALARSLTIIGIFGLCFGAAAVLAVSPGGESRGSAERRSLIRWWLVPGLLFFSLVFLSFVNSGYLLVLSPPVFAILGERGYHWLSRQTRPALRWASAAAFAAVNTLIFVGVPLYCSYRSVRALERDVEAIVGDLRGAADPERTLIVGFDSHFLGYRHGGYYLPEFVTAQYPEVRYPEGNRVFLMNARKTRVVERFDAGRFERVILFPLPQGGEYSEYLAGVEHKLPAGTLESAVIGSRRVWTAPASAIPLLFPATSAQISAARK